MTQPIRTILPMRPIPNVPGPRPGPAQSITVHDQPPSTLGMQVLQLDGTLDVGMSFASVDTVTNTVTFSATTEAAVITPTGDFWISSNQPITIRLGDSLDNQVIASWWDAWARPRCIRGYAGAKFRINVAVAGVVCVWGATKIEPAS